MSPKPPEQKGWSQSIPVGAAEGCDLLIYQAYEIQCGSGLAREGVASGDIIVE
jgi:hypothetical protein